MRRILNTKLGIIALVLAIAVLVTGVTWAATGAGPSSQTFPEGNAPQIIVTPLTVEVGGSFEVLGCWLQARVLRSVRARWGSGSGQPPPSSPSEKQHR